MGGGGKLVCKTNKRQLQIHVGAGEDGMKDMPDDAVVLHHRDSVLIVVVAILCFKNKPFPDDLSPNRLIYADL